MGENRICVMMNNLVENLRFQIKIFYDGRYKNSGIDFEVFFKR